MENYLYLHRYTPVGDVLSIIFCIVAGILLHSAYTVKQRNLKYFNLSNGGILIASVVSIFYNEMIDSAGRFQPWQIYLMGDLRNITLIFALCIFFLYISVAVKLDGKQFKRVRTAAWTGFAVLSIFQCTTPMHGVGIYIDRNMQIYRSTRLSAFDIAYICYVTGSVLLMAFYRERLVTRVRQCLQAVVSFSVIVIVVQAYFREASYTCATFSFPTMACLYLFHYNAYDQDTGTLDRQSFYSYIEELAKQKFVMISMTLRGLDEKKIGSMADYLRHFCENFFKEFLSFRINTETLVLVCKAGKNGNLSQRIETGIAAFGKLYEKFMLPYKLTVIESDEKVKTGASYLELVKMIESRAEWNSCTYAEKKDIEKLLRENFIYDVVKDIAGKDNLMDERVVVYCQPVLDTKLGQFTTAEALMRLYVPDYGTIYPDEFIHIAEKNDLIHTLSRIILHKTCLELSRLEEEGYDIERISVNFSMLELHDKNFCDDILKIIEGTGIATEKIAIELTESRNEQDYEMMKGIMRKMHRYGIKFYLDDFGTGYSNFEKIVGLPIDIIKFDRSLTIMSGRDDSAEYMVGSFAKIFNKSDYRVLFEGIEDDADEKRCISMGARYLQGYKYSRPIPIENLRDFLTRSKREV